MNKETASEQSLCEHDFWVHTFNKWGSYVTCNKCGEIRVLSIKEADQSQKMPKKESLAPAFTKEVATELLEDTLKDWQNICYASEAEKEVRGEPFILPEQLNEVTRSIYAIFMDKLSKLRTLISKEEGKNEQGTN